MAAPVRSAEGAQPLILAGGGRVGLGASSDSLMETGAWCVMGRMKVGLKLPARSGVLHVGLCPERVFIASLSSMVCRFLSLPAGGLYVDG